MIIFFAIQYWVTERMSQMTDQEDKTNLEKIVFAD